MNKEKGFTLIELMGVLVILSILAVIVVPVLSGLIINAKIGVSERSIEQYVEAINLVQYKRVMKKLPVTNKISELDIQIKNGDTIKNPQITLNVDGSVNNATAYVNGFYCVYNMDFTSCTNRNSTLATSIDYVGLDKAHYKQAKKFGISMSCYIDLDNCDEDFDYDEVSDAKLSLYEEYYNNYLGIENFDRDLVRTITFYSEGEKFNNATYMYDVSSNHDRSIYLYMIFDEESGLYDVRIVGDRVVTAPENSAELFAFMPNLTIVDFNNSVDSSRMTNAYAMFSQDENLIDVELTSINVNKLEDTSSMFYGCYSLYDIDMGLLEMPNLIDTSYMFYDCENLVEIDNITIRTNVLENTAYMFGNCSNLTAITSTHLVLDNVRNMEGMFFNCQSLLVVNAEYFFTDKTIDMSYLFANCGSLEVIDVSHFKTSNVTNMESMFENCVNLKQVILGNFDTSKVENMSRMFKNCTALSELDVSSFNTSNVTLMNSMFYNSNIKTIDISNFDTRNVTNLNYLFYKCNNLKTIYMNGEFNDITAKYLSYIFGLVDTACKCYVNGSATQVTIIKLKEAYRPKTWTINSGLVIVQPKKQLEV